MWAPDLVMINNVYSESELQSTNTVVQHDGSVYQAKMGNLRAMIEYDLKHYPYDVQRFDIYL